MDVRLSIKDHNKAREEMTADKSIRNLFLYIEELYICTGTGQSSLNVILLLKV
jgi:hypothetical protein